jgi:hypothetical protein
VGKPTRSIDSLALRDNPRAMAEGAPGSPIFAAKTGAALPMLFNQAANNTFNTWSFVLGATYDVILIEFVQLLLAGNDDALSMLTSSDSGANYDNGASDYAWAVQQTKDDATTTPYGDPADGNIKLWGRAGGASTGMTNTAAGGFNGHLWLFSRSSQVTHRKARWEASAAEVATLKEVSISGSGRRLATAHVNAIRFYTELGGNFHSGIIRVFGVQSSDAPGNWP